MAQRFAAARILIVDDEPGNIRALTRILTSAGYENLISTMEPGEVLALVSRHDPDLILLDLHMPGTDGVAVLTQVRAQDAPSPFVPVVMLTGDTSVEALQGGLGAGANDFILKPFAVAEVLLRIHNLLEIGHLHRQISDQNRTLEARVAERTAELGEAYLETLQRLARAAEFRDDDTGRHTERVGEAASLLAAALGLASDEVFHIRRAAPLHDVGKIGIPDAILRKADALTPDEVAVMQTHAAIGARILAGGRSPIMRLAEAIALGHHERWDGSGYPGGVAGEAIPLAARIVCVADVFDALTSDRVYRRAVPVADVIGHIRTNAGRHFDPRIAGLFDVPGVVESLVGIRMQDGRPQH